MKVSHVNEKKQKKTSTLSFKFKRKREDKRVGVLKSKTIICCLLHSVLEEGMSRERE
jgi:hypothetical protein